jgi:hypothetical protein
MLAQLVPAVLAKPPLGLLSGQSRRTAVEQTEDLLRL